MPETHKLAMYMYMDFTISLWVFSCVYHVCYRLIHTLSEAQHECFHVQIEVVVNLAVINQILKFQRGIISVLSFVSSKYSAAFVSW